MRNENKNESNGICRNTLIIDKRDLNNFDCILD